METGLKNRPGEDHGRRLKISIMITFSFREDRAR